MVERSKFCHHWINTGTDSSNLGECARSLLFFFLGSAFAVCGLCLCMWFEIIKAPPQLSLCLSFTCTHTPRKLTDSTNWRKKKYADTTLQMTSLIYSHKILLINMSNTSNNNINTWIPNKWSPSLCLWEKGQHFYARKSWISWSPSKLLFDWFLQNNYLIHIYSFLSFW